MLSVPTYFLLVFNVSFLNRTLVLKLPMPVLIWRHKLCMENTAMRHRCCYDLQCLFQKKRIFLDEAQEIIFFAMSFWGYPVTSVQITVSSVIHLLQQWHFHSRFQIYSLLPFFGPSCKHLPYLQSFKNSMRRKKKIRWNEVVRKASINTCGACQVKYLGWKSCFPNCLKTGSISAKW